MIGYSCLMCDFKTNKKYEAEAHDCMKTKPERPRCPSCGAFCKKGVGTDVNWLCGNCGDRS